MTTRSIFSRTLWRYGRRRQPRLSIRSSGKTKWERYENIMTVYDFIFLCRMKTKIKICTICSKIFTPFSSLTKTCSLKCENKRIEQREKEKRQKVREKKKNSVASLWNVCLILWSKAVRKIGYCEVCGATEHLQAHHIFSRVNRSTRWELTNGVCLCPKCHIYSTELSAHGNPYAFAKWLDKHRGEAFMEKLYELSRMKQKVTEEYLKETIDYLKRRLEE